MGLTNEEMDEILDSFSTLIEQDEQLVAIDIEHDEQGENPTIYLRHLDPNTSRYREQSYTLARNDGTSSTIPVVLAKSDEIVPELAGPDEKSVFDELADVDELIGMAGTKIVKPSGSWGTICLSGGDIKITFGGKTCRVDGAFVFTNSHVAGKIGNRLSSFHRIVGEVDCLFDLDDRPTFDYGQAPWSDNLQERNFFKVYSDSGQHKNVKGLQPVIVNERIGKQGAETGWTTGRATGKSQITLKGHKGTFRCWKGTYESSSGDSGSPILTLSANEWYHVGIHFASGPYFQSWDDAQIKASK